MKLHFVELENWKKHTKTKINFDEGTTVIYGPNETGKSTVLEALSRGLFDKSSSHAEAIKCIKPLTARGNVTSTIRIEFTLNKTRYRVDKNFNLRRGTLLNKIVGEKTVLQAQDNSADEQLLKLLEADLPSSRGSKPSQWGAFRWLWAPQENRGLPTEKEGDPTTVLHLETGDGADVLVTPKFQALQNLVQASYARYFTKTGRNITNSPVSNTEEKIQTFQQSSVELASIIKKVEDEKQQLAELQRQLPELEKKLTKTKEELEKAGSEAIDFSSIESKLKASEAEVKEIERDVQDANKAIKEIEKSAQEIEQLQKKEKKASSNLSRLEAVCDQLEKRQQEIKENVEKRAMKIRECEELTRDARILWTISETMKNIELLRNKTKKINDINEKVETLRKDELPLVPTDEEIEKLIQSQTRIEALKESLTARGLAVTVTPGEKGSLVVKIDGEGLEEGRLSATGTESVNVGAPGFGEVAIKARLKQARDAKVDIKQLEESIQGALNKYAVNSIGELKKKTQAQKDITNKTKVLDAERRGIDGRPINEITLELNLLEEKHEEYKKIKRIPNTIKLNPTDVDLGNLVNKREKEQEDAKTVLDRARTERDGVDNEFLERKQELAGNRAEQKHCTEELDKARNQEREIIRQHGSVENQEKIIKSAEANLKKRTEVYEKIKRQYEELEKGPVNRIIRLKKQIDNQEKVIQQQRTSIDQLEGGIRTESLGGAYSELAEIESSIEILNERIEKERIRAESYKLLKETLEQQYRSTLSAVVGPIQDEVKRSLSYVTGFLHDDVELNEYLFPIRLGERGFEDISLEFNDASSGLKEVLALCV
jgi:chromosome segregation ATPase